MIFEKIKSPGLAHLSYFISTKEEAVVVDPRRDIDVYLKLAKKNGVKIKYILETHRQEDFILGSAALKQAAGAAVAGGSHQLFSHCDLNLAEGQVLNCANLSFKTFATPGHTPESVSYAVYIDDNQQCWGVFTGDALFIGDTGRTDLPDKNKTKENALILYESIHQKIATLGPQALIFPAHGSGSVCGGAIAAWDQSTLGFEQSYNPVFTLNKEEFAKHKLHERIPRPPYFDIMEEINLNGGSSLEDSPLKIPALTPQEFEKEVVNGKAKIIDTRLPEAFAGGHVKNSFNVWLQGLAVFGGWILNEHDDVYLICERPEDVGTAFTYLARLGVGDIKGFLAGGFEAWRDAGRSFEKSQTLEAQELRARREEFLVFDVREINEYEVEGHIPGAKHCYVGHLPKQIKTMDIKLEQKVALTCSVGHRGSLAASIFLRSGFKNISNLAGGMKAWKEIQGATSKGVE